MRTRSRRWWKAGCPSRCSPTRRAIWGAAYGVYDDEAGVDVRGRFIIDPDGVIQAMEVLTPPVGRVWETWQPANA